MLLGLDLGTTNIKAVVVDAAGATVTEASAPVDKRHAPDGRREEYQQLPVRHLKGPEHAPL